MAENMPMFAVTTVNTVTYLYDNLNYNPNKNRCCFRDGNGEAIHFHDCDLKIPQKGDEIGMWFERKDVKLINPCAIAWVSCDWEKSYMLDVKQRRRAFTRKAKIAQRNFLRAVDYDFDDATMLHYRDYVAAFQSLKKKEKLIKDRERHIKTISRIPITCKWGDELSAVCNHKDKLLEYLERDKFMREDDRIHWVRELLRLSNLDLLEKSEDFQRRLREMKLEHTA
ncbi:MAG: hypothetical protein LBL21_04990 [Rickettsiales bacterium]|jgi:hypothetical protein|nr:hypothetical protein [Rickettsiales bacterium]